MYIVFEGIDGCGKSTQCKMLGQRLNKLGYTPIHIQEPSYGELGRRVRYVIRTEIDPDAGELHKLFTQDRVEHVRDKILPALRLIENNDSFILLQNRGYLSAPAYQAGETQDIFEMLKEQQAIAPRPNMFIYIDIDEKEAMDRIRKRNADRVTFDTEDKLKSVRQRYLALLGDQSERIVRFDGNQDEDDLHNSIFELVCSELRDR